MKCGVRKESICHLPSTKDKLSKMLEMFISITNKTVRQWKADNKGGKHFDIVQGTSILLMECVLQCIFGVNSAEMGEIEYHAGGKAKKIAPGWCMRDLIMCHIQRRFNSL
jgi:hypothetical protein